MAPLKYLGHPGSDLEEPSLIYLGVREHSLCFLKGSLPLSILQTWPEPPRVAAMNLKDLNRLRLLLDFISRAQTPLDPTWDLKDWNFCLQAALEVQIMDVSVSLDFRDPRMSLFIFLF